MPSGAVAGARPPVIPTKIEREIANKAIEIADKGFDLSRMQMMRKAGDPFGKALLKSRHVFVKLYILYTLFFLFIRTYILSVCVFKTLLDISYVKQILFQLETRRGPGAVIRSKIMASALAFKFQKKSISS